MDQAMEILLFALTIIYRVVAIQIYERRRLCGAGKESGGVMTGYPIATPPRLNYGGGQ